MIHRFKIFIELHDGSVVECFTWRGDLESGKSQALIEALERGLNVKHAWGVAA